MNNVSNKLLIVLVIFALVGVVSRSTASTFDSPISPLPSPTPTEPSIIREPPAVCEMTLECAGSPGATQRCNGFVTQDEGRTVIVELHTKYMAPNRRVVEYASDGLYEWFFQTAFASVPCFLGKPYAKLYLKVVDMVPPPYFHNYICQEIMLTHDGCTALPLVPQDSGGAVRPTPRPEAP